MSLESAEIPRGVADPRPSRSRRQAKRGPAAAAPWPFQGPCRLAPDSHLVTVEGVALLVNPETGNWLRLSPRGGDVVRALATSDDPFSGGPAEAELLQALVRGRFLAAPAGNGGATAPAAAPPRFANVLLNLTHRCNLRCQHCAVYAETAANVRAQHLAAPVTPGPATPGPAAPGPAAGPAPAARREPDTAELLRLVDRLAESGARRLVFFGGEPLVRRDFPRLLEHAAERIPRLGLTTNGTLLTPELCDLLARHRVEVRISLEGSTPPVNDAIRGRGSFAAAHQGLLRLLRAGHRDVAIKCVITRVNLADVPLLVKLARRLEVALELSFFVALGRGEAQRDRLAPSAGEVIEALERVWLLADYYGVPSATFNAFCRRFMSRAGRSCGAGAGYTLVDWTGAVYPCEGLQSPAMRLGSLEDAAEEPLAPPPDLSVDRSPVCSACPVRYFCRGGCAAETVAGTAPSRPSVCPVYRRLLPSIAARWQPESGSWRNQRSVLGEAAVDVSLIRPYLDGGPPP